MCVEANQLDLFLFGAEALIAWWCIDHVKRALKTLTNKPPYCNSRVPMPNKITHLFAKFLFQRFPIFFRNINASKSPTTSTTKSTMTNSKLAHRINLALTTTATFTSTASLSASTVFNQHTVHIPPRMGPPELKHS